MLASGALDYTVPSVEYTDGMNVLGKRAPVSPLTSSR